jgi:hypothetical protein
MIYKVAKERASSKATAQKFPWMPALSEFCGIMMDTISYRVMEVDPTLFAASRMGQSIVGIGNSPTRKQ